MKQNTTTKLTAVTLCSAVLGALQIAVADEAGTSREDVQRALNKETMATPFNPGDIKKAQAYAEDAKKQNVTPVAQPPAYWVPGWTCANMISYVGYAYMEYQGCVYYHYYYGRYWR